MKILILGASGMLGNAMFRLLSADPHHETVGTVRNLSAQLKAPQYQHGRIIEGVNVENFDSVIGAFAETAPDLVINCIGIIKQLDLAKAAIPSITTNALLPHKLANLARACGARFIHISTDCVFAGTKGNYCENDFPDSEDLYGRSKLLGEVTRPGCLTLRTSIIGHELSSANGLIDWFLSQSGAVKGFTHAIFSGLPTVELATIVRDLVLDNPDLEGLYHLSTDPISKFNLIALVADRYGKQIEIIPDGEVKIDRSLDSSLFRNATGYTPPSWKNLVKQMYEFG